MDIERLKYLADFMFWPLADLILAGIWVLLILTIIGGIVGIFEHKSDEDK